MVNVFQHKLSSRESRMPIASINKQGAKECNPFAEDRLAIVLDLQRDIRLLIGNYLHLNYHRARLVVNVFSSIFHSVFIFFVQSTRHELKFIYTQTCYLQHIRHLFITRGAAPCA